MEKELIAKFDQKVADAVSKKEKSLKSLIRREFESEFNKKAAEQRAEIEKEKASLEAQMQENIKKILGN